MWVITSLDISADNDLSPEKIAKYCNGALQVIAADEELHCVTQIFSTITISVKCTLKIYLKKCKNMVFELPEELKDLDSRMAFFCLYFRNECSEYFWNQVDCKTPQ